MAHFYGAAPMALMTVGAGYPRVPACTTSATGPDVESDLDSLEANGMRYEVKSYNPDGSGTLLWAYCKGATGPRIELVSRAMEPFIEYWWSTAGA
jgi:hypothetical protein